MQPPLVKSDHPEFAAVEQQFSSRPIYKVTGKSPGIARLHAEGRGAPHDVRFQADLIVTVIDKPAPPDPSDFIAGFMEGISQSTSNTVATLKKSCWMPPPPI